MKRQDMIHMIAGTLILASTTLGYFYNIRWLFLGMFIGLNLFQYSLTGFCPMEKLLKKLGVQE